MASDVTYEQAQNMDHLMSHEQFNNVLFPEMFTLAAPQGNDREAQAFVGLPAVDDFIRI